MYALILATGLLGLLVNQLFTRASGACCTGTRRSAAGGADEPRARWPTALEIAVPLALLGLLGGVVARAATRTTSRRSPTSSTTFADTWLFERVGSRRRARACVRLALGYGIACVVAVALGLALGLSPPLRRAPDPIVQFLRAIPPPALLPFGILVLGVGDVDEGLHHRLRLPLAGAAEHDRRRRRRRPDAARDRARLRHLARATGSCA